MDYQTIGTVREAPATLLEQVRLLSPPVEQPPEMAEASVGEDTLSRQAAAEGAAHGYQRRSPVQPYRVPPEYYRRQRRRILAAILAVVVVAAGVFLFLRFR